MLKLGKGWRKWLMIGFLVVLGVLAVLAFTTGCSKAEPATTTTPLQALQNDMDGIEDTVNQLVISDASNGNSISVLETWKTGIDTWKASVNEKIANLESGGIPEIDLSDMEAEIAMLDLRLIWIENMVANGSIVSPTATPTATGTPTPTPTPTSVCLVTKPSNPFPADGTIGISENNIELKWSDCHANNYMLYVGINSSTSTTLVYNGAYTRYYYDGLEPNTYYYWKVIAVAPLGCPDLDATWSFRTQ